MTRDGLDRFAGARLPLRPPTTFPRASARTQRVHPGCAPRDAAGSHRPATVLFIRARDGTDPVGCLWALDIDIGAETAGGRPAGAARRGRRGAVGRGAGRRERAREAAAGIVGFATDDAARSPRSRCPAGCGSRTCRPGVGPRGAAGRRPGGRPAARPDRPLGRVRGRRRAPRRGHRRPRRAGARRARRRATVQSGALAEFVAAEEMDRLPRLLVVAGRQLAPGRPGRRAPVQRWHIADPAQPERPAGGASPTRRRGRPTPTSRCTSWPLDGSHDDQVTWDRRGLPLPRRRALVRGRGAPAARDDARPARPRRCWTSTRRPARPRVAAHRPRRRLARRRGGRAGLAAGRPAGHARATTTAHGGW